MSDPNWPTALPPAPPVADYPLRLHPVAAPAIASVLRVDPARGPSPVPPTPYHEPDSPSRRTAVLAAVSVVLFLALAATAIALTRPTGPDEIVAGASSTSTSATTERTTRRSTTTTQDDPFSILPDPFTTTPPGPKATEAQILAEVQNLQEFVEETRGLTFTSDVTVKVLAPDAFSDRVLEEFEKERDRLEQGGALLEALGILAGKTDPTEQQLSLLTEGVLGFYDPKTGELVVKGEHITPMWREIVVHELTHAIDDQNLELDRPDLENRTDGSDWPFLALTEGSARRVERAYVEQLSEEELQELMSEFIAMATSQSGGSSSLGPGSDDALVLGAIQMSPYSEGEPLVAAIVDGGDTAALNDAFASPPISAEQVLHPEKYDAREAPVAVAVPEADGTAIADGVLGEYLTGMLLNRDDAVDLDFSTLLDNMDPSGDPSQIVAELIFYKITVDTPRGWGGDHYVVWKDGADTCVRIDWRWDTPGDRTAFQRDLETWAEADQKGTVDTPDDDTVRLTRCT